MAEQWYRMENLPDLTLNKYSSLDGSGVDGVIEKHIAFLRQLNRKGIVSNVSFHLFYLYLKPDKPELDTPGQRLQIFLLVRGSEEAMSNIPALIDASPLSEFFKLKAKLPKNSKGEKLPATVDNVLASRGLDMPRFSTCCVLTKSETLLPARTGEGSDYYMIREWEMNEDGRLYNMCKMMETLNKTVLYRVDLYPVERSVSLREALRKPMSILRKRQEDRSEQKDYDGKDVLKSYEDLIEEFDSSPHFIANIMVFANSKEDAVAVLDAAGSEALMKGKYSISTFGSSFNVMSFLNGETEQLENIRERMILRKGKPGLTVCREDTAGINLNYLPSLFSLEELAPFFRLPALYDGETIQLPKETAPAAVDKHGALFLGKDRNGYDVFFPLKLLPKHAFISGVPGSGKTNTMHHITSTLWKDHGIPFLVLEPAKQEYRALANDPGMKGLYIFSPNADMSFPLHINPFEMPKDTMVAEHIRRLCSVFEGAFPLEPPMPFLLDTAIEAVYRENGWIPEHVYSGDEKTKDGKPRPLPTMSMLYKRLEQELESTQYSDEVRGNLESALKVRIGSLLRREMGDIFDVPQSTFTPEEWLQIPAVIELESMGTGPANFLTLMLLALIRETLKVDPRRERDIITADVRDGRLDLKYTCTDADKTTGEFIIDPEDMGDLTGREFSDGRELRIDSRDGKSSIFFSDEQKYRFVCSSNGVRSVGEYSFNGHRLALTRGSKDIRHVIFIEEAHNLIGPESEEQTGADADPKIAATAFVVKMLAEVRALKEGIVIADQLPTVMAAEVLKNTGLKLGLRITSQDDRSLLGSTMAASGLQLEEMATFAVGEALIFYEKLLRPFNMRVIEWWGQLGDTPEKEAMVTPKNDTDLRAALMSNAEFRDANDRSISIIGKKYLTLLERMDTEFREELDWCSAVKRLKDTCDGLNKELLKKSRDGSFASEEEKAREYDRWYGLTEKLNLCLNNKKSIKRIIATLETLGKYVFDLDRLKKDRWTRAGAGDELMIRITRVQGAMADRAKQLYGMLADAVGRDRLTPAIDESMTELIGLSEKIDADLEDYARRHPNK